MRVGRVLGRRPARVAVDEVDGDAAAAMDCGCEADGREQEIGEKERHGFDVAKSHDIILVN